MEIRTGLETARSDVHDFADRAVYLNSRPRLDVMVIRRTRDISLQPSRLGDLASIDLISSEEVGPVLTAYADELYFRESEEDLVTAARLSRAARDLVEAARGPDPNVAAGSLTPHQRATIMRIKAFVLSELANPGLNTRFIAREIGLSPRYMNKLFEAEDATLWRFIMLQRLSGAARDLADVRLAALSIREIGRRNGFRDPNHFSSSFRTAFGRSPRAYRNHCRTEQNPS